MQHKVKYECGHEGYINVIKGQEWKLNERYLQYCPECYTKIKTEQRKIEIENKIKEVEKLKIELNLILPELQGTEKQIKWANSIREDFIISYKKITDDKFSVMYPLKEKLKKYLETENNAEEYIKKSRISLSTLYDFLENY